MKVMKNCSMAFKLVFRYAPWSAVWMILGIYIPGFFPGLQVILVQRLVDRGIVYVENGQGLQGIIVTGVMLVTMLFFWVTLQNIGGYSGKVIETRMTEKLAPDIMDKLKNLEFSAFEQKGTQEILQRISKEPWQNISKCFQSTVIATQGVVSIFFTLGVYMSISVWIGIGLCLIAVPMILLNFISARRRQQIYRGTTEEKRRMTDLKQLIQNKHAVYEMKVFESQELLSEKWQEHSGRIAAETNREMGKIFVMEGTSVLLSIVYFIFIIVTLSYSLIHQSVTLGQFVAVFSSISSITGKMNSSSWRVSETIRLALDINYYREFLALPGRTDKREISSISHQDIVFENVSFAYPGTNREILHNVTFRIKAGERVAFVGENGAGKSTIIKLLCGLYEPVRGRVMIGGVNVRDLSEELRRKLISVVFQDFQGYEVTLRENVAFGDISKLGEDGLIWDALKLADASELAETEQKGLDRNLGHLTEDGKDLSKGQWQRVAMARAFLSNVAYVILDEPTASLDPIAESHMYENFSRIFSENGTIMISHRLASAKMADRILVLDGGRIVQEGSHEKLMCEEGLYSTMYLAQSSWYVEGGEQDEQ